MKHEPSTGFAPAIVRKGCIVLVALAGLLPSAAPVHAASSPQQALNASERVLEDANRRIDRRRFLEPKNPSDVKMLPEFPRGPVTRKLPASLLPIKEKADYFAARLSDVVKTQEQTLYLAGLYEYLGYYEDARRVVAQHLQLYPENVTAIVYLGWLYYLDRKYSEAFECYNLAAEKDPRSLEALHGKMLVFQIKKDLPNAKLMGRKILAIDPKNITAAVRLGNLYFDEKKYDFALQYYQVAGATPDGRLGMGLCYFEMNDKKNSKPLLALSYYDFPGHQLLQKDLIRLNEDEITSIKRELRTTQLNPEAKENKKNRLAFLYESNGNCPEPLEFIRDLLPLNADFNQVLRIAYLLTLAGFHEDAGKYYELAALQSPRPHVTMLAAVDSYLAAKNWRRADELLTYLKKAKLGWDIDQRYAVVCLNTGRFPEAQRLYWHGAQYMEKTAPQTSNPRGFFLTAIDYYIAGKFYPQANRLLAYLIKDLADYDTDSRFALLFFEGKQYEKAIDIYKRYPGVVAMQVSRGWALYYLGKYPEAERVFRDVLDKYPTNIGATQGLAAIPHFKPWSSLGIYSHLDYGGYQDTRRVLTSIYNYNHRNSDRGQATLVYSRTDVNSLTPGNVDYNENLYGAKFYYKFSPYFSAQAHGLSFSNDDAASDQGKALGGTLFFFPLNGWDFGLEIGDSDYQTFHSTQVSPRVGYRFSRRFKLDIEGCFASLSGKAVRSSVSREYAAVNTNFTFNLEPRFNGGVSVWLGRRMAWYDATGMYAYNTLDEYRNSGSFFLMYDLSTDWKAYSKVSVSNFLSEWQMAANETLGYDLYNPDQSVKVLSLGLDTLF